MRLTSVTRRLLLASCFSAVFLCLSLLASGVNMKATASHSSSNAKQDGISTVIQVDITPREITHQQLLTSITRFRGSLLVVYFWKHYSIPQRRFASSGLIQWAKTYQKNGLSICSLCLADDEKAIGRAKSSCRKLTANTQHVFPSYILVEPDGGQLFKTLNISRSPAFVLINSQGKVIATFDASQDYQTDDVETAIKTNIVVKP
jgi:hypothetical protein